MSQVYAESIDPGDEIGPLIKLPDMAHVQAFLDCGGSDINTNRVRSVLNRFNDVEAAKRDGLPAPILPGALSQAYITQLLTDWVGDAGRVQAIDVSFRRSSFHDEELKCIGLVTDKVEQGDMTLVKLDIFTTDPRGDRPTQGTAEVLIPTHV